MEIGSHRVQSDSVNRAGDTKVPGEGSGEGSVAKKTMRGRSVRVATTGGTPPPAAGRARGTAAQMGAAPSPQPVQARSAPSANTSALELTGKVNSHRDNIEAEKHDLKLVSGKKISKEAQAKKLNMVGWKPIENFSRGNGFRDLATPVNQHLDKAFANYGETGLCSITQKATSHEKKAGVAPGESAFDLGRPTNFWKSEMTDTRTGESLFKGWRSGCMAGKFLGKTDATAEKVALDNAREFLTAIAIDKMKAAGFDGSAPINLTSINLMDRGGSKVTKAEAKSIELQEKVLRQVAEEGVQVNGETVKFSVNCLSIPTNSTGVFGRLASRSGDSETIRNLCAEAAKTDDLVANLLANEIKEMMDSKFSFSRKIGYEFPALVSNLAFQMGHEVAFNCKSGKDRTGMMDISSKFVALRAKEKLASAGRDTKPVWDVKTGAGKELYTDVVHSNCSLEITKKNTGATGLKIQGAFQAIPADLREDLTGNSGEAET